MRVRFWGTRGSIGKAGPSTLRYGGHTCCVEVRSDGGTLVVLDLGSGAHGLGQALLDEPGPLRGHVLITHTHWDHIQGMPFFAPLFVTGNEWDIYAPRGLAGAVRDTLAGQMEYTYFPVGLEDLGATIRYHELLEGELTVGDVLVRAQYLNHPALTLGYRLEVDGASLVYATDHEPHSRARAVLPAGETPPESPEDDRHAAFMANADLVIHDAQFTAAEYPRRQGWGHSTVEYVVDTVLAADARRVALFHHDPLRDDDALDRLVELGRVRAGDRELEIFGGSEGRFLDLSGPPQEAHAATPSPPVAEVETPLTGRGVVLALLEAESAAVLRAALAQDRIPALEPGEGARVLALVEDARPALVLLGEGEAAFDLCRAIRRHLEAGVRETPVVVVAGGEVPDRVAAWVDAGATDSLIRPFTEEYARTRIRAWILRQAARWLRAPLPTDEPERLASLRGLGLLDTPPEERFDRLTRLAQQAFRVPIALVTLLDAERQWFKSCRGLGVRETSREASFCAHALLGEGPLVVPDALRDDRFAGNPLVRGEPHIRFYAGHPVTAGDGRRVGTLCLIDRRPRQLGPSELDALRDLAGLVERELTLGGAVEWP